MAVDQIALNISSYYKEYISLLEAQKVFSGGLNFEFEPQNGKNQIKKNVRFADGTGNDMAFIANQLKNNDYRILLFQKSFIEKPIIRFDSDGPSHYNQTGDMTRAAVPTPHFHKYNAQGQEYAYLTPELEDTGFAGKVKYDIKAGMQLFCKEAAIMCDDDFRVKLGAFDTDTLNINNTTDPLQDFY